MLFSVILGIYAVISPYFMYRFLKIGVELGKGNDVPSFIEKKPKVKPVKSKQMEILSQDLANIDRYDGTNIGQKEIR